MGETMKMQRYFLFILFMGLIGEATAFPLKQIIKAADKAVEVIDENVSATKEGIKKFFESRNDEDEESDTTAEDSDKGRLEDE